MPPTPSQGWGHGAAVRRGPRPRLTLPRRQYRAGTLPKVVLPRRVVSIGCNRSLVDSGCRSLQPEERSFRPEGLARDRPLSHSGLPLENCVLIAVAPAVGCLAAL